MEHNQTGEPANLRVIARPRPFSDARIDMQRPAGATIAEHMRAIGMDPGRIFARVFIDDRLISEAEWEVARPEAGQLVTMRAIPTGGAGGGKDALRVVAMIAIAVVAVYTGGAAATAFASSGYLAAGGAFYAGQAIAAGVMLAGALAVNGHIPRSLPRRAIPRPQEDRSGKEAA